MPEKTYREPQYEEVEYLNALRVASLLLMDGSEAAYRRGIVNFLADFYAKFEVETGERMEEISADIDREIATLIGESQSQRVVFIAGFVTDSGTGGFEWRTEREILVTARERWIADEDADVSEIKEVRIPDGIGAYADAITAYLDECPEFWEPRKGEGR